ncbi:MAG: SulP family inorganic anion transporter [Planctomycetota bacterium]|jgi:MFS superfamily sulfate permease-like transporter
MKLTRIFPFLGWFKGYGMPALRADLISGITVALVLVPQSMAYAQLAGLPAYYGLYASLIPPAIAALFGSSRQLATGPVAIVSLMTAATLAPIAVEGSEGYLAYAVLLALMVGAFQLSLGILRLGVIVNLLSHPVIVGFTNAAAIVIATSQLSKIFGVTVDKAAHHYETVSNVIVAAFHYTHWPTFGMAALSFAIMYGFKKLNPRIPNVLIAVAVAITLSWMIGFEKKSSISINQLESSELRDTIRNYNKLLANLDESGRRRVETNDKLKKILSSNGSDSPEAVEIGHELSLLNLTCKKLKAETLNIRADLRAQLFGAVKDEEGVLRFFRRADIKEDRETDGAVWRIKIGNKKLDESAITMLGGGAVVGVIPKGIPALKTPRLDFSIIIDLFPMAIIISLLGFMEAISIAKAMAAKTGQRLDPNQELIGQGLANILGSAGQSYPVSGSFSRSAVNLQAGAISGLSSVFTSGVVALTLLFFTPLLYNLPQAVLAAVIMMAVIGLIHFKQFVALWGTHRIEGVIALVTFISTLAFAPHLDRGIFIGVGLTVLFYLFSEMRPDVALLSKFHDGSYRSAEHRGLKTCKYVAVFRCNGSIFFGNADFLEKKIIACTETMPELKHILIVGNGINSLDASGSEMFSNLVGRLRHSGYDVSFSGLNDHLIDTIKHTPLYGELGEDHMYPSVNVAMIKIHHKAHENSDEDPCPLTEHIPEIKNEGKDGKTV